MQRGLSPRTPRGSRQRARLACIPEDSRMTTLYPCGCHTIRADSFPASTRHAVKRGEVRHGARGNNEHKTGAIRIFGNKLWCRPLQRPLVATQHDGGTFFPFFFRSLHDCRTIPTYCTRLSQTARGYMMYLRLGARVVIRREEPYGSASPPGGQLLSA